MNQLSLLYKKAKIFVKGKIKNLTTEVAEHAEIKLGKGLRPRGQGNKQPHFGLSEKDLCGLRFLFGHPLFFIRAGSRKRKTLILQRRKEPQTAEVREDAERMKFP